MQIFNKKAFTIMEVVVSIFIFVIITGIIIADYRKAEHSDTLRLEFFNIEDSIRAVYNMSITGKKIQNQIPGNAYGINLNTTNKSYVIFGDKNDSCKNLFNDNSLTSVCSGNADFLDASSTIKDELALSFSNCGTGQKNNLDIIFNAPRGKMRLFSYQKSGSTITNLSEIKECSILLTSGRATGTWQIYLATTSPRIDAQFIN